MPAMIELSELEQLFEDSGDEGARCRRCDMTAIYWGVLEAHRSCSATKGVFCAWHWKEYEHFDFRATCVPCGKRNCRIENWGRLND